MRPPGAVLEYERDPSRAGSVAMSRVPMRVRWVNPEGAPGRPRTPGRKILSYARLRDGSVVYTYLRSGSLGAGALGRRRWLADLCVGVTFSSIEEAQGVVSSEIKLRVASIPEDPEFICRWRQPSVRERRMDEDVLLVGHSPEGGRFDLVVRWDRRGVTARYAGPDAQLAHRFGALGPFGWAWPYMEDARDAVEQTIRSTIEDEHGGNQPLGQTSVEAPQGHSELPQQSGLRESPDSAIGSVAAWGLAALISIVAFYFAYLVVGFLLFAVLGCFALDEPCKGIEGPLQVVAALGVVGVLWVTWLKRKR